MEEWKSLSNLGYSHYAVSSHGRIKNVDTERILRQSFNINGGGMKVGMIADDVRTQQTISVARLVATMFIPRPQPRFDTPINKDGNQLNNEVYNLEWRPRWFALVYRRQFNTEEWWIEAPFICVQTEDTYRNSREIVNEHGVLARDIVIDITNQRGVFPDWLTFAPVTPY